jgi:hypothetical protein
MPGLIRGVARTAVIAGTATAVSNGVSRRQAGRWAAHDERAQANAYAQQQHDQAQQQAAAQAAAAQAAAAPPAAARGGDLSSELQKLADLKAAGVLSDAEFAAAKAKLLGT